MVPGERRDFSSSLLEAIAFSALNFAVLLRLITFIFSNNFYKGHPGLFWIAIYFIMVIMPIIWPILLFKLLTSTFLGKYVIHPIQKPWDFVFGKRQRYWIIIHLKNGRKIGGKFGENSFASSYPADEQIYLEEVWELDEKEKFIKPVEKSKGMIILKNEILAIEFFQ